MRRAAHVSEYRCPASSSTPGYVVHLPSSYMQTLLLFRARFSYAVISTILHY